MKSCYSFLTVLTAVSGLMLKGCVGVGRSTPPVPTTFQLTVTAPATGAGTITSSPGGISCPSTCAASFTQGTQVTLTETPGTNYFFSGWSGGCTGTGTCTVTLNAAVSVTPTFTAGTGVTVTVSGQGTGTRTRHPAGVRCPTTRSRGVFAVTVA